MGDEETVVLNYAALSNITFHGKWDTGIPRSEWEEMTMEEQDQVFTNALYEIVEIWEVPSDA
jgi:hypothetical protein